MTKTAENPDQYSTKHPHEPEILPALDEEGRCRVCGLLVRLDDAVALLRKVSGWQATGAGDFTLVEDIATYLAKLGASDD